MRGSGVELNEMNKVSFFFNHENSFVLRLEIALFKPSSSKKPSSWDLLQEVG